jgi:hypothetical protein
MYRLSAGAVVLWLSFHGTLLLLSTNPDCRSGEKVVLTGPYPPLEGHAYKAPLPTLVRLGDTDANLFHSPALLCEGDTILGPPHTFHAKIVEAGLGRFSHYGDGVVFSSSDNTDPNSNGRQYTIVVPRNGG